MTRLPRASSLDDLGAEAFLAALVRSTDDAIVGKTTDGVVVFWNAAAERLYGYAAEEMLGRDVSVLFPPDRPFELAYITRQVLQGNTVRALRTDRLRKDGAIVPVLVTVAPVLDEAGTVIGASTIARDLSQNVEGLRALEESERKAAEALSTLETWQASAPIGLGFADRDLRFVHMNDVLVKMTGTKVKDPIGKTPAELVPELWAQLEPVYRRVLEHDEAVLNVEVTKEVPGEPGRRRYLLASYYPVHVGREVIGVGVVVVDVTEQREPDEFRSIALNQMAEGLLATDGQGRLTYMNQAVTRMLGWTEADLKGKRIHDFIHTRRPDGSAIPPEECCDLQRVCKEGRTFRSESQVFTAKDGSLLPVAYSAAPVFTGSLGTGMMLVFRDITEERAERLRVKRELDALTWVGRIRDALEEERFVLYSQPILPLRGGQAAEELLLRMVGRDGELVSPNAFLGVAEKYGLITELDLWVIKRALRLAAKGHRVGINISAESIVTMDLVPVIGEEIEEAGADPAGLVFEITETALMRDMEKGAAFANGVVDLGCGLALDDFGTGFGTFTHVKRLPITYLKIDVDFVRDLEASLANQHVVKAIVNLAQGFGCKTVAEGVEDSGALALLQEYGVDFAQGFHLGRPAPLVTP